MNSMKHSLAATAKATGVAAALVLGLTLSTGGAAAHTRTAGPDATLVTHRAEQSCDKDQVLEAALHAAEKQVQRAFTTNHLAIEQLREKSGERNKAARDLLKQADSELKGIRATAKAALDAADESVEDCTTVATATVDGAAIEAIVAQATADMETVVSEVTATVAALPAPELKAEDEDEDEDNDEDADEGEDEDDDDADHETKSAEKSGEKSSDKANTTSKGHSKR